MDTVKVQQNIKELLDKAFDLHQKAYKLEADAASLNKSLNDYQRKMIAVDNAYKSLIAQGLSDTDIILLIGNKG
jgi:isopenicillin N synthase-like dioxygenase